MAPAVSPPKLTLWLEALSSSRKLSGLASFEPAVPLQSLVGQSMPSMRADGPKAAVETWEIAWIGRVQAQGTWLYTVYFCRESPRTGSLERRVGPAELETIFEEQTVSRINTIGKTRFLLCLEGEDAVWSQKSRRWHMPNLKVKKYAATSFCG